MFNLKIVLIIGFVFLLSSCSTQLERDTQLSSSGLPTLIVNGNSLPCISYNISTQLQRSGAYNSVLLTRTTDKTTINQNRNLACKQPYSALVSRLNRGKPRRDWFSCDEFPFASTLQGGSNAQALIVRLRENSRQGGQLNAFYKKENIVNNDNYLLKLKNVPSSLRLNFINVYNTSVCTGAKQLP